MSTLLEKANQLFDEGEYCAALDIANELIEKEESLKEAYLLRARCYMMGVDDPKDNGQLAVISNDLINAINLTNSVEEAFEIIMGIKPAISIWKKNIMTRYLAVFEAKPNNREYFDRYIHARVDIIGADITISMAAKRQSILPSLLEKEGMVIKDAVAKYENGKPYEKFYDDTIADTMEFEAAQRVMENLREFYYANIDLAESNQRAIREYLGHSLIFTLILYDASKRYMDDKVDLPDYVKLERMKEYAEWKRFMITAQFNYGRRKINIYPDTDGKEHTALMGLYDRIKELDPSFEIPYVEKYTEPQQSSGGCYVATAVYGSYDCPQVWTLRRYRDDTLAQSWYGRAFIKTYYAVSPTLVRWFGETKWFKSMWQGKLDRMVEKLQANGVESTPYEDKKW